MPLPPATLSFDLDNLWSYLKTHGDSGWQSFPTYLDRLVPRVLSALERRGWKITFFIVGQDAALEVNREPLAALATAGHEIGNHSFHHEPWLHRYTACQMESELALAEENIERSTGQRPVGFRGPGFSLSAETLQCLARRGYLYDASTFPTFLGPLARAYYFWTARLSAEQKAERKQLFGRFAEGFRPLAPYVWQLDGGPLVEIPVTTMPWFRTPIHLSYLLYLARFSRVAARAYFNLALTFCRWSGVPPSILLHPLDFLGADDVKELAFFPAMDVPSARKLECVNEFLDSLGKRFEVGNLRNYAQRLATQGARCVVPRFPMMDAAT
jgi:peptidoglycan/xylan/chitin deacetylase (PgdA/CDA1 family)